MENYKIIMNPDKISTDEWNSFIANHPDSNAFHTPEFFFAAHNSPGFESYVVAIISDNGLEALLTAYKNYTFNIQPFKYLSSRFIIHGIPLCKNNDTNLLNILLDSYLNLIKNKGIYTQVRNYNEIPSDYKNSFSSKGFVFEEHLNIQVNLTKGEEQLWKEVKSKRRNKIRRATKEGTSFDIANTMKELEESYAILQEVYKRAKLPLPDYNLFINLLKSSNNQFRLLNFLARNDEKIIGCMIALSFKDKIFDYFAGARKEHYSKYPNDLIPWEVFKWGKNNGYRLFDFGGAGKPNVPYGVRDYKKKFGGEFVNYGRYEKVHSKFIMKISVFGFNILRKVKNGL